MPESFHVVCPRCRAVNRVLSDKLAQGPTCGKCQGPLFDPVPVNLDQTSFDAFISRNDLPVLVDFWAPWCGPCKSMAPAFAKAAETLVPSMLLAKVDTQAEQGLAARFGIQSIPTMVLFKNGRELSRTSGAMGVTSIVGWARGAL